MLARHAQGAVGSRPVCSTYGNNSMHYNAPTVHLPGVASCQWRTCQVPDVRSQRHRLQHRARAASRDAHCISRQHVLRSTIAGLFVQLLIGSDDPTTIVNSVLSAYGLPTLKAAAGFKLYDDFDAGYAFEYPKSWVVRPNTLRQGIYISDFQTADKITLEVFSLPADRDLTAAAVAAAVVPGAGAGQQDSRLELPPANRIQQQDADVDGQHYTYLAFPSETITRSGYQVRRRNYVSATLRGNMAYVLSASARTDQCDENKVKTLRHVVESFRVRG